MNKRPAWTRATIRTAERSVLVLVGFVALAAACVPSDPASTREVAVRRSTDGTVEVLPCTSEDIEHLQVVAVEDVGQDREEQTLWDLKFDSPAEIDSIEMGDPPSGADIRTPWQAELFVDRPGVVFSVRMWQDNGNNRAQSFTLADLDDDTVLFGDEAMTSAEFADADACDR